MSYNLYGMFIFMFNNGHFGFIGYFLNKLVISPSPFEEAHFNWLTTLLMK